jgi:acetylornithine deacetylase/succinyl-diaminopimelate desuccinylase-like protein
VVQRLIGIARTTVLLLIFGLLLPLILPHGVRSSTEPDWDRAASEAVELLANYIRIDTTNPPGNEDRAARFFAGLCDKEGIEYKVFDSAPGRGSIYARLKGSGHRRALILLNHMDVVPADRSFWSQDPFAAVIRDGYLYGRGALDMKSLGAAELMAFLLLKRSGTPLDRDVIFLGTADEEAGGRAGAGWFAANHADLIRDAEFLITEGSSNLTEGRRALYYGVGVTEKTPCWLRLTAKGMPGHGSVPRPDSAPSRLIRALGKIEAYQTQLKAVPAVSRYFASIAPAERNPVLKQAFSDIVAALQDPKLRAALLTSPQNAALLRNTIQPTVVNIGAKTNVIPPIATAEIDCRLLPGERPEEFVAEIKRCIADRSIEVETLLAFPATESPADTDLFKAITGTISSQDPSARFVPTVLAGFTDSHYFRELGIVCYGFSPFLIPGADFNGVHGNNERISVEQVGQGTKLLYAIVERLCRATP